MAHQSHGPAYNFWLRIRRELDQQGLSLRELAIKSGVPTTTIGGLKTRPPQSRADRFRIVHQLADALNIPHNEAEALAGLTLPDEARHVDLADAIAQDERLTPAERRVLLDMLQAMLRARDLTQPPGAATAS